MSWTDSHSCSPLHWLWTASVLGRAGSPGNLLELFLPLEQQQQRFNGRLSGTTRVGRYQKKHSPAHTHPDQHTSFILSPFATVHGILFIHLFLPLEILDIFTKSPGNCLAVFDHLSLMCLTVLVCQRCSTFSVTSIKRLAVNRDRCDTGVSNPVR